MGYSVPFDSLKRVAERYVVELRLKVCAAGISSSSRKFVKLPLS
jgi:hypothetical protein